MYFVHCLNTSTEMEEIFFEWIIDCKDFGQDIPAVALYNSFTTYLPE